MNLKTKTKTVAFTLFFLTILFSLSIDIPSSAQTQEKPLEYEVEVVLIEIPVYVVGKDGNPVLDLKAEDFVLYEDGKQQKITHFALIQNDSPEIQSLARRFPAARRQFFLLFDMSFASPRGILRAREAGLKFVKDNILPHDLVAVASSTITHGIQILTNFTSDKFQLENFIGSLGLVPTSGISRGPVGFVFQPILAPTLVSGQRETVGDRIGALEDTISTLNQQIQKAKWEDYKGYVQDYVGAFKVLGQALNVIKGRKHLVLFSEGFDIKVLTGKTLQEMADETEAISSDRAAISRADKDRFGDPTLRLALTQALQNISSADCLIHTIDVGGLRAPGNIDDNQNKDIFQSRRRGQDTLHLISKDTGGKAYRNVNELDKPLENILKLTNSYYLLGYYPQEKKEAGKFRKLKIEVSRPKIEVSHRKGYFEEKPYSQYTDFEKRLELAELVIKDVLRDEIKVDHFITSFEGTEDVCRAAVFLQFPGNQFLEKKKKNVQYEIFGYAIDNEGRFRDFFFNPLNVNITTLKDKLKTHGVKYFDLLLIPPGDYKIKCIIRNTETGETGVVTEQLHVPKYDDPILTTSPPLFIDRDPEWLAIPGYDPLKPTGRKGGEGLPVDYPFSVGGEQFFPGVRPTYFANTQGQFLLRVHNLKLHPTANVPQTDMKFEVVDDYGVSHQAVNILSIKPFQINPKLFELLFEYEIKTIPSGTYRLKVTITDKLTQQTVTSSSLFIYK